MDSVLQMFRLIRKDIRLLFVLGGILFFILPMTIYGLSDLQFICATLLPIVVFISWRWFGISDNFILNRGDFGLALFIGIGFLSFWWAIDGALVWYQGFGWAVYFLLMITARSLFINKDIINIFTGCLVGAFLIFLFSQFIVFSAIGLSNEQEWHQIFGRNGNYTSCLLVILYPYFLFQSGNTILLKLVKSIGTILMLVVFYFTTSKGIIVALPFIGLLWVRYAYPRFKKVVNILLMLGIIVWILGFALLATTSVLDDFYNIGLGTRAYMLKASYSIFVENPISGIGLGNWFLKAYNYGVEEIRYFGNSHYWIRYHSHNLYGRLLAELGVTGLLAFLFLFGNLIRNKLFRAKKLEELECAALSSLILYLLLSFFYNVPTFSLYTFSGIQFIVFAGIGLLTVDQVNIAGKAYTPLVLLMAVLATGWFSFSAYNNHYYHQGMRSIKHGDPIHGLKLLESIYKPNWNTSHNYKKLIPFQIAQLANKNGLKDRAILYYEEAISKAPYNGQVLFEYGKLLANDGIDLEKAEELLLRVDEQQSNRYAVNYLLARVYYAKNELSLSQKYVDRLKGSSYQSKGDALLELIIKRLESDNEG